ncbi:hypothetical protein MANES_07G133005v8 [Manihot esculenta]|uniref:Uncharacterized protein n=1 Tax=Manihot esculenta TaxID=3983 RepID=A0ACB7HFV3_MANES|nr:hypothetical protein MANES_07G133005v8 [Manihot esculenta]
MPSNVRLRSLSATTPIAFKVQTSWPHKFLVNPPTGLIPPSSSTIFQIILRPQTHLPSSFPRSPSDHFLIKTAPFPPNSSDLTNPDSLNSWFSSLPLWSTQDFKLKVAFVGPFLLRHAVSCGDVNSVKNIIKRQRSILSELSHRERLSRSFELLLSWLTLRVCFGPLDLRDKEGRTPLHFAAGRGNIKCARVLVESGADKDANSKDGRTALYRAAANGDHKMVEMLIEMGSDPTIADNHGRSAFDVARDKGHKGANKNYKDQYGFTALHAAAIKGHKDIVSMLVEFGVDLECQDNEGHSSLHFAVEGGSLETVEVLVGRGANVNAMSNRGATPLYMARTLGYTDISQFLVSRGASLPSPPPSSLPSSLQSIQHDKVL